MRLATLNNGSRDGELILVSHSSDRFCRAADIAKTLQQALDDWSKVEASLRQRALQLEGGMDAEPLNPRHLLAPLPRAYEWLDGSLYLNHVELVRRARGAAIPDSLRHEPLVYQGGSGVLLAPCQPFELPDASWGLDFEAELCVVVSDVAQATSASQARQAIRLLMLANDWSYRNLIPNELSKGFGFVISKPATAFAPFAVTPDELGAAFDGERVHLPVLSHRDDVEVGAVQAGDEMHFSFCDLIEFVCRTRSLVAGTILGSGTVSNRDASRGASCIAELRMRELFTHQHASTPFLSPGERVRIEVRDGSGWNVFGSIEQQVLQPQEASR